jgi:hypothetical protein
LQLLLIRVAGNSCESEMANMEVRTMTARNEPMDLNTGKGFLGKTATAGRTAEIFVQRAGPSSLQGESWNTMTDRDSARLMEERYAILEEGIF